MARLSLATRLTARWSALWFLAAFTARPLFQLLGGAWAEPLRQRRYIGLGFAVAHTIHAAAFITLIPSGGASRPWIVWVVGGTGYLLMWTMAATSNDKAVRLMGRIGTGCIWLARGGSGRSSRPAMLAEFRPGSQFLGTVMVTIFVAAALTRLLARIGWPSRKHKVSSRPRYWDPAKSSRDT